MRTEVCIVLDRSGSMGEIRDQIITGYNEHVQQIKMDAEEQKGENEFFVSLITFTGKVYEHLWRVAASELKEITKEDYIPCGSTALYDAQAYAIERYIETTDITEKNASYLLLIITDGKNEKIINHSLESVRELNASVQKNGNWTITYMGCDGKYLENHAKGTGVALGNVALWAADQSNTREAFSQSRHKLKKYSDDRKLGIMACNTFHSEDATAMANYVLPTSELVDKFMKTSAPLTEMPHFGPVGNTGNWWTRKEGDLEVVDVDQVHAYLLNYKNMDVLAAKDYRRRCEENVIMKQAKAEAAKPTPSKLVSFKDGNQWRHVRT